MKLPVLLAVAALAVCLTGCSHAQTDATPSATSETAEAAATATPATTRGAACRAPGGASRLSAITAARGAASACATR